MKILITGTAGFIGYHLVRKLLEEDPSPDLTVIGADNINDYYDVNLKYGRLEDAGITRAKIEKSDTEVVSVRDSRYRFIKADITDGEQIEEMFAAHTFDTVVHLAAQAGVRYSLENPDAYIESNISGFFNILKACKERKVRHLVYASSSSVYGANTKQPFSTQDDVSTPVSLYAATKKSNELMAYTYSHLFRLPTTGLRFFTVYGPWGRPDMALFIFVKNILKGTSIEVNNRGNMRRDFTYIDDIVNGILKVMENPPDNTPPYAVYNIGRGEPVGLMEFIEAIEQKLGLKADKNMRPLPQGDVPETWADTGPLREVLGYQPKVSVTEGVGKFIDWYRSFYKV